MKKIIATITVFTMLFALNVYATNKTPQNQVTGDEPHFMSIELPDKPKACRVEEYELPMDMPEERDGAVLLPPFEVTYDPLDKTNLTGVQLETLAPGLGEALYKMEQKHGVNAIFCLSVGWVESGWKHTAARNNYWGITKVGGGFRSWDSLESAIDGFGAYMNQKMYHGKPIEQVAKIYCPPTWQKWAGDVRAAMAGYFSEVE